MFTPKETVVRHARYVYSMFLLSAIVGCMQYFATHAEPNTLLLIEGWFDKIQHFLAGSACGVFGVWLARLHKKDSGARMLFIVAASSGFVIGFGWEIFEHVYPDVNGGAHAYSSLDTRLDLVCDTLGAIVAAYFFRTGRTHPT